VARVNEVYLFESDLKGIIPPGTSAKDSLMLTRSYIDSWIRKQLIVRQAMNNLSEDQLEFSKQLDNYKNSLIIYAYENTLVRQKLDTLVSDEEIENYYDAN